MADEKSIKDRILELQFATVALQKCINTIYRKSFTPVEIAAFKDDCLENNLIAASPLIAMTTHVCSSQMFDDLVDVYKKFGLDGITENELPVLALPIVSGSQKQYSGNKPEEFQGNKLLPLIGCGWLDAITLSILKKRYPYASSIALEDFRSKLLTDSNITEWFACVDLKNSDGSMLSHEFKRNISQNVYSYLGEILSENNFWKPAVITTYISKCFEPKYFQLEKYNIRGLFSHDKKMQVLRFFEENNKNKTLLYKTVKRGNQFKTEINLGETPLCVAEGKTVQEAEQNASSHILNDESLLSRYSVHIHSIPILPIKNSNEFTSETAALNGEQKHINTQDISNRKSENRDFKIEALIPELSDSSQNRTTNAMDAAGILSSENYNLPDRTVKNKLEDVAVKMIESCNDAHSLERKEEFSRSSPKKTCLGSSSLQLSNNVLMTDPKELPLLKDCDKTCKAKLYEKLGKKGLLPNYATIQLDVNDFYSVCSIRNSKDFALGHGRGSNKKIAEQTAASYALKCLNRENEECIKIEDATRIATSNKESKGEQPDSNRKQLDYYTHFQNDLGNQDYIIHHTSDKMSMAELYALLGSYHLVPTYKVKQVTINHFYAVCSIATTAIVLGEGHGTNKRIAQQIAAKQALESKQLTEFLK